MTNLDRRIALLTGAAVAVFGTVTPALAATTSNPGPVNTGLTASDTITISTIASPSQFGVTTSDTLGNGTAAATSTGGIVAQTGFGAATLDFTASNSGTATLAINAGFTATTGSGQANANLGTGILQMANSATGIGLSVQNSGQLNIGANANAAAVGAASATATIGAGIKQTGNSATTASASIANAGLLNIGAGAIAIGSQAVANANVGTAVVQDMSYVTSANVVFNNTATAVFTATANAAATSGPATATAAIDGVHQIAVGINSASATFTNAGTFTVAASANAFGPGPAAASAIVSYAVLQDVTSLGAGDARAQITNSGSINVRATAIASGSTADAMARINSGLVQNVAAYSTGDAYATITNGGSIGMTANAVASALSGAANADAVISSAIVQNVDALENGSALLSNTGTITLAVLADAVAANGTGIANATIDHAVLQTVLAGSSAAASFDNVGGLTAIAVANASGAGAASANANVDNGLYQIITGGTAASARFDNGGSVTIQALAAANADAATAHAFAEYLMEQDVTSGGDATAAIINDGNLSLFASALANADAGSASAVATANEGVIQEVVAGGAAYATFINSGGVAINAKATANGTANAFAQAIDSTGIKQSVNGTSANAYATNSGSIRLMVDAVALAAGGATASATAVDALRQEGAGGAVTLSLTNSGSVSIGAHAVAGGAITSGVGTGTGTGTATGTVTGTTLAAAGAAFANASARGGLVQQAGGTSNSLTLVNSATVDLGAYATAQGASFASAAANAASALAQRITATDAAVGSAVAVNSGTINIVANANAVAVGTGTTTVTGNAFGSAIAGGGIVQSFAGGNNVGTITNNGMINATANAYASGITGATAYALGQGVIQSASAGTNEFNFLNSGTININLNAVAVGTTGSALAMGTGYAVLDFNGGDASVYATNSGTINVNATASAPGAAAVEAYGIHVVAGNGMPGSTTSAGITPKAIGGSIVNSGAINVVGIANGGTSQTATGTGTTAVTNTNALSSVVAAGIYVESGVNNMTITNSGSINVDAITGNGGLATAYGIRVQGNGAVTPAASDVLTINNSGDITVRISQDGGTTFHRGTAIDVSEAPNASVINLLGGNIFGNIDDQTGDAINVTTDETLFNGIINPECLPAGGPTALTLDDPTQNACGQGSLTISGGGALHLVIDPVDGPSYGFVNDFTVATDGTIIFDLPSANGGGTIPIGTYPQIFTQTANLAGTLIANIPAPANGLFDNTVYENVIDAVVRNGTFDQCIINGVPSNSLLISADCIYDSQANVDIGLTRTPFDQVPGLGGNGAAVGSGLECIFDTSLTGGIADLLSDLFLFTDPINFNIALNQLSGSSYANYLQSFPSLGVHYNDLLDHATNCEVPALAGSVLECRASSPIHVWGQLDYQWRKADGDNEAGTTKSKRFSGLLGVDANVGQAAIVGVSAGYVTNHTRDNQFGDKIDADGYQVGAYGVYDPGAFYLKAMTTYSWYDGDASRNINFAGLAPGATFAGGTDGDPDVTMWTFGLHGGYRMGMGANSALTPYLNYDYVNAKLKSFTESGLDGANLTVEGGRSKHSFLTGGVKYATQLGGVVPEVNLGYRYRFGSKSSSFTAAFLGDTSCEFDINSASHKRGSLLAGLSIGGKMGPVDLRIGYEGEFNSDITSHSGNFKIVLPLGGHAAPPPPPPPVVEVAPPPPPPVEVAPPPPPPPPPPAPVERGERGQ